MRELEKRCELQSIKHEELLLEIGNLKYLQEKTRLNEQLTLPDNFESALSAAYGSAAATAAAAAASPAPMSFGQQRGYRLARTGWFSLLQQLYFYTFILSCFW